jgi:hypothetical protein
MLFQHVVVMFVSLTEPRLLRDVLGGRRGLQLHLREVVREPHVALCSLRGPLRCAVKECPLSSSCVSQGWLAVVPKKIYARRANRLTYADAQAQKHVWGGWQWGDARNNHSTCARRVPDVYGVLWIQFTKKSESYRYRLVVTAFVLPRALEIRPTPLAAVDPVIDERGCCEDTILLSCALAAAAVAFAVAAAATAAPVVVTTPSLPVPGRDLRPRSPFHLSPADAARGASS